MILRAKIALQKGDVAAASKALDAVKTAPGMNARDMYRAEQQRIRLTLEAQKKFDDAATEYRRLVDAIAKEKDVAAVGATRDQALVGLGNCLLAMKKEAEARGFFEKATASLTTPTSSRARTRGSATWRWSTRRPCARAAS